MKAKVWCLQMPDGSLNVDYLGSSSAQVMFDAYGLHASIDPKWGDRYWMRWPASGTSLRGLGYRAVLCDLKPVKR